MKYDIAAFIWPSYTGDEPRTRIFWPEGYGEWQTVKAMKPMFEGHQWPRRPLWGLLSGSFPQRDMPLLRTEISAGSIDTGSHRACFTGRPLHPGQSGGSMS